MKRLVLSQQKKHLYNFCTMLGKTLGRRCTIVMQMFLLGSVHCGGIMSNYIGCDEVQ